MKRSEISVSRNRAPVRRRVVAGALGVLMLTSCGAERDVAGVAVRAPQATTVQELPETSLPSTIAPAAPETPVTSAPRSSETQPSPAPTVEAAAQSPEVAKDITDGLETVIRRMQYIPGAEPAVEGGHMYVTATVVAPTGSQLASSVAGGHASAYRLRIDSSVADTVIPVSATIGAYYNTNADGSHADEEHAAFEVVATQTGSAWEMSARFEGGTDPLTLSGSEALDDRDSLLALAAHVADAATTARPINAYNE